MSRLIEAFIESLGTSLESGALQELCSRIALQSDENLARDAIPKIWKSAPPHRRKIYVHEILKHINCVPDPTLFAPSSRWVYRGCKTPPDQAMRYGFEALGKGNSLYEHKWATGTGRYVACSKSLQIAGEHAGPRGFIYRIHSNGGIDCAKWFDLVPEIHSIEKEVSFIDVVPSHQIHSVAMGSTPGRFVPLR